MVTMAGAEAPQGAGSSASQTRIILGLHRFGGKHVYGFAGNLDALENPSMGLFVQHSVYTGARYFDWDSGFVWGEGQGRAEVLGRDTPGDSFSEAAFQ